MERFSDRLGIVRQHAEITIRHDAPEEMRGVVVGIAEEHGLRPMQLRQLLCRLFFKRPDPNNWSEYPNVADEVRTLIDDCAWYDVYDAIEAMWAELRSSGQAHGFELAINRYFERAGIGWRLSAGRLEMRGGEAFEEAIRGAQRELMAAGKTTSATELHEAIVDLSRRPAPEVTGAIQHAMAALECLTRDVVGSSDTLGSLVRRNSGLFPKPLDSVVEQT